MRHNCDGQEKRFMVFGASSHTDVLYYVSNNSTQPQTKWFGWRVSVNDHFQVS